MKARILGLLAATAITTAGISAASAADLPVRAAPPLAPIIAAAPVFTWTGFYVGVNAGWGWQDNNNDGIFVPPGTFAAPFGGTSGTLGTGNGEDDGFVGGGQIGYNVQFGTFVLGVEADIHWADFNVENNITSVPANFPPSFIAANINDDDDDMEWFGTVRARAGVAFGQALIYATGGLAYTDDTTGWVAGGGVEWALPTGFLGSAATIGLEGLWVSLDEDDDDGDRFIGTYVPTGTATRVDVFAPGGNNDESEFFVARAKLNFKFGTF